MIELRMQIDLHNEVLERANVSRETLEDLKAFAAELEKWSSSINLVAPNSLQNLWNRHILDSAQLKLVAPIAKEVWCDLGSGGGLPGLVIAILQKEVSASFRMILIESDARKAAFLKMMTSRFELNATVVRSRIDEAPSANADVVSARALAPLEPLLKGVYRHIRGDGVALLPKGRNFQAEVEQARCSWHFDLEVFESLIDAESRILRLRNIQPKGMPI